MKSIERTIENHFFLFFCIAAVLYALVLAFLRVRYAFSHSGEMLILFAFPIFYAAVQFPKRSYIPVVGAVTIVSLSFIYTFERNPLESTNTVFFIIGTLFLTGELVFRSNQKWRNTEQKLAEQKEMLQTILDGIPDIISLQRPDHSIVSCNKATYDALGKEPGTVVGRKCFELLGRSENCDGCPTQRAMQSKRIESEERYQPEIKRWFDARSIPIQNSKGEIVLVVETLRDVTDLKETTQALVEQEARFHDLFETIENIPVQGYDADRNVIYWNPASEKAYGYTKTEALGKKLEDLIVPEGMREGVVQHIDRWLNEDIAILPSELTLRHKNGSDVAVYSSHVLITNNRGNKEMYCIDVNMNQLKQTEKALRESEEKYRRLFETMSQGVVYQSADGSIVSANPAAEKILGLSRDRMMGKTSFDPDWKSIREDGSEYLGKDHPTMTALRTGRAVRDVMGVYNKTLNAYRWIDVTAIPLFHPGESEPFQVYATFLDITQRKQIEVSLAESKRQLTTLMGNLPGMAYRCICDRDWTMQFVSEGAFALTGFANEELIGNKRIAYADIIHPDDREFVWKTVQAAIAELRAFQLEYRIHTANDGEKWVWERGKAIVGAAGKIEALEGFISDITDRKRAEEEKLKLEEQLQQSQKMEAIGTLAGGVAHDFNNILMAILGYSQMVLDRLERNHPLYDDIQEIQKAGKRASSLTQQLLAFGRKQMIQPAVIDLNKKIEETHKMLGRLLGEDIEIRIVTDPALGTVKADSGQIDQIVVNIAVNARDAMPTGGVFTIETHNTELDADYCKNHMEVRPGPYVSISFSDTGTGMSKETQGKIFEPFYTTKEKAKGTGLGLSTVYGIVKQNNGHVTVYSEEEKGTTFNIYLPRIDGDDRPQDRDGNPIERQSGDERILIVEDDDTVREYLLKTLSNHGYSVQCAANCDEAEQAVKQTDRRFELLITDVVLPGRSGKEVSELLTKMDSSLKTIFMSGYTEDAIVHHHVVDEGITLLQKPFPSEVLLRTVRETLDT